MGGKMNILTSFIFGLIQLTTFSWTLLQDSMRVCQCIQQCTSTAQISKEIKRTLEVFLFEMWTTKPPSFTENFKGQTEVRVRSKNQWTMVDNPQNLSVWFEQMDLVNGDRSRCKFQGNTYVMWMNGHYIMIADDAGGLAHRLWLILSIVQSVVPIADILQMSENEGSHLSNHHLLPVH